VSTTRLKRKYRCLNDCLPQGCPEHVACLEFQSTSDALSFDDGKGFKIEMQPPELEAFLHMLKDLVDAHEEISSIVKTVFCRDQPSVDVPAMEVTPLPDYLPTAVKDWLKESGFKGTPDHINFEGEMIEDGSDGDWIKYKQGEHVTVTAWERVEIKARFRVVDGNWTRVEEKIEPEA
jgi:hypothetical protein